MLKFSASEIQISFLCLKKNMNLGNNCYQVKLETNHMKVTTLKHYVISRALKIHWLLMQKEIQIQPSFYVQ